MPEKPLLSKRVENLHGSPIRETLSLVSKRTISFAGGLPDAGTFPIFQSGKIPSRYLQYGPTEGEPELRALLARELDRLGFDCAPEQVLVLSGSQQGIDLAAKLFIDPGTVVALESPTYLAALQVFGFFRAKFKLLRPGLSLEKSRKPAFVYLNSTFQNPTGRCLSLKERHQIAQECDRRRIPLFEDDPYRDLAYGVCDRTPVCSLLKKSDWIYQGSFSKTLAPGLRIGFLASSRRLFPHLSRLKQAADLHTNRVSQWFVLEQLRDKGRQKRMTRLVQSYRRKRDFFAKSLDRHFSGLASWQVPEGGLFFWLALKRPLETRVLFRQALGKGVAFMPGEAFFVEKPAPHGFMRLNFSHASENEIDKGLRILSSLIHQNS